MKVKHFLLLIALFISFISFGAQNCRCWEIAENSSSATTFNWSVGDGEGCCSGRASPIGITEEYTADHNGVWVDTNTGTFEMGIEGVYQLRCCKDNM